MTTDYRRGGGLFQGRSSRPDAIKSNRAVRQLLDGQRKLPFENRARSEATYNPNPWHGRSAGSITRRAAATTCARACRDGWPSAPRKVLAHSPWPFKSIGGATAPSHSTGSGSL